MEFHELVLKDAFGEHINGHIFCFAVLEFDCIVFMVSLMRLCWITMQINLLVDLPQSMQPHQAGSEYLIKVGRFLFSLARWTSRCLIPCRYAKMCSTAFQCCLPGLARYWFTAPTAAAMSGRVVVQPIQLCTIQLSCHLLKFAMLNGLEFGFGDQRFCFGIWVGAALAENVGADVQTAQNSVRLNQLLRRSASPMK